MEIEAYIQHIIDDQPITERTLPSPEQIPALIDRLREEMDNFLRVDPHISLRFADEILHIGTLTNDLSIQALGNLARADVFWNLHQNPESWALYTQAGDLFQRLDDRVGWARTRIGRLAICVEMNAVEAALQDAEEARNIFLEHGKIDRLIRLDTNMSRVYNQLTWYEKSLKKCQEVLDSLTSKSPWPETTQHTLIIITYLQAAAYQGLGKLEAALKHYQSSRNLMVMRGEKHGIRLIDLNILNILQAQGHNKKALRLLHHLLDVLEQSGSLESDKEIWHINEGLLFLNRFQQVRVLAQKVILRHPPDSDNYDLAMSLVQLATAEIGLGNTTSALQPLEQAQSILERLNATAWLGLVNRAQAQAALNTKDLQHARKVTQLAIQQFEEGDQQLNHLATLMLMSQIELAEGQSDQADQLTSRVQKTARTLQIPHLRYQAHVLAGKIAEQKANPRRAIRHYRIAMGIMDDVQRSLVITSRSDYLIDKQEAVQALIRLHLQAGQSDEAFYALECAKAQVWLSYLKEIDHLRWQQHDPEILKLIDTLHELREQHFWYYQAAHDPGFREQHHPAITPGQAELEARALEKRLRDITEQLYLHTSADDLAASRVVPVASIQAALRSAVQTDQPSLMIAYYADEQQLWAFVLDGTRVEVYPIPKTAQVVETLLSKWQTNINRALRGKPDAPDAGQLSDFALSLAQQLYDILLRPFAVTLATHTRLVIVPYGALHYLPFQCLHDGTRYLLEQFEIVILPTASLLVRQPPRQMPGALGIAHDWNGRLQHAHQDAQQAISVFGGDLYRDTEANQALLNILPRQILHISAHGQHRIDQPDFSYIQLADGPVYTDDLFQYDLRYELVTLSACETGRSQVKPTDELIGLGRGFLFAGAGALIATLWKVEEQITLEWMEAFYRHLATGASKAAALRHAASKLMHRYPRLHPAYWGAFQLIGSPAPLSTLSTIASASTH